VLLKWPALVRSVTWCCHIVRGLVVVGDGCGQRQEEGCVDGGDEVAVAMRRR
jgi:hypothetical protein